MKKLINMITILTIIFYYVFFSFINEIQIHAQEQILNKFITVSAGYFHTLAVRKDGTVWAWGSNNFGQLGDGTNEDRIAPVQVIGLKDIIAVASGSWHSLALDKNGAVWAWGSNHSGELGDGTNESKSIPVKVKELEDIVSISAGFHYSAALKKDGTVWDMGSRPFIHADFGYEQGYNAIRPVPEQVPDVKDISYITVGEYITMAVNGEKNVWIWENTFDIGENGCYDVIRPRPVRVEHLSDVSSIGGNREEILFVKSDGTVWCWKYNDKFENDKLEELIIRKDDERYMFQVQGLNNIIDIAYKGAYVALDKDGFVWTWRYHGKASQPEDVSLMKIPDSLEKMDEISEVKEISVGYDFNMFLKNDGTICGIGANDRGQLGNGTITNITVPKKVPFTGINNIAAGDSHTIFLKDDGSVWACGNNDFGQLGDGTYKQKSTLTKVEVIKNIKSIDAGRNHCIALDRDGFVWTWGRDCRGAWGDNSAVHRNIPIKIESLSGITEVHASGDYNLALKDDGTAWIWVNEDLPAQVQGVTGIADIIDMGLYQNKVLRLKDGTVWVWKYVKKNVMDDGNIVVTLDVKKIEGLDSIIDISCLSVGLPWSIVVLKADGTVWICESSDKGEIKNIGTEEKIILRQIKELPDTSAIATGDNYIAILDKDGMVWTWGNNSNGQLGNGTVEEHSIPTKVKNLKDIAQIVAGKCYIVTLSNDHTIWSWGDNSCGQTGHPTTGEKTPVKDKYIVVQIGNPYMSVNGRQEKIDPDYDTSPVIINGRTLLPIRAIIERLGGIVDWEREDGTIILSINSKVIELKIGSTTTIVNGAEVPIDVAPQVLNGRTMIPLRYVAEHIGCIVQWNDSNQVITISY